MLSYTDLTKGVVFILSGEPWEVLESHFLRMQQRKAVVQTKIKNLINGKIVDRNFQSSDEFEEAEIERIKAKFIYNHRGEFWFNELQNTQNRFQLKTEALGYSEKFLKPNLEITAFKFSGKIINIELPVKADYKVAEAPPAIRGDTAQGGTKIVTIETGAKISTPLFIGEGDVIKINTETGDYVERVEKS